jgi:ankyrin repeat protein
MRGDAARVRALLSEDPQRIHERGAHDFALLWYTAIGGGRVELAELLLDAGAEVERQHHLGTTALHWAAMRGQVDLAALLLERGADPNRAGRKFGGTPETPLELALGRDQQDVAALLRDRGARV